MREINFTPLDEIIDALRLMHAPVEHYTELNCEGCGVGFEGEEPEWPCQTASLVYDMEEIADILEASALLRKWLRQMRNRNPTDRRGWSFISSVFPDISLAYQTAADSFISDKVFPSAEFHTNTVLMRFSKELLEDT